MTESVKGLIEVRHFPSMSLKRCNTNFLCFICLWHVIPFFQTEEKQSDHSWVRSEHSCAANTPLPLCRLEPWALCYTDFFKWPGPSTSKALLALSAEGSTSCWIQVVNHRRTPCSAVLFAEFQCDVVKNWQCFASTNLSCPFLALALIKNLLFQLEKSGVHAVFRVSWI